MNIMQHKSRVVTNGQYRFDLFSLCVFVMEFKLYVLCCVGVVFFYVYIYICVFLRYVHIKIYCLKCVLINKRNLDSFNM